MTDEPIRVSEAMIAAARRVAEGSWTSVDDYMSQIYTAMEQARRDEKAEAYKRVAIEDLRRQVADLSAKVEDLRLQVPSLFPIPSSGYVD